MKPKPKAWQVTLSQTSWQYLRLYEAAIASKNIRRIDYYGHWFYSSLTPEQVHMILNYKGNLLWNPQMKKHLTSQSAL